MLLQPRSVALAMTQLAEQPENTCVAAQEREKGEGGRRGGRGRQMSDMQFRRRVQRARLTALMQRKEQKAAAAAVVAEEERQRLRLSRGESTCGFWPRAKLARWTRSLGGGEAMARSRSCDQSIEGARGRRGIEEEREGKEEERGGGEGRGGRRNREKEEEREEREGPCTIYTTCS